MLKLRWNLIISSLLLLQVHSASGSPSKTEATATSPTCTECSHSTLDVFKRFAKDLDLLDSDDDATTDKKDAVTDFADNMNKITDGILDIEIISDKMNYNNKCDNFVGNGEVNSWGEIVRRELGKNKYDTLISTGPRDISLYCPNFARMEKEDRKALFVLTMTAMAHYESSCNFREKATGPNGTAAGLLQLHKGKEGRYSSGCKNGDSATASRTLICGLSMLNDQTIGRGERLFSSASYWEVLRPRGRSQKAKKIMTAITKFPACASNHSGTAKNVAKRKATQRIAER